VRWSKLTIAELLSQFTNAVFYVNVHADTTSLLFTLESANFNGAFLLLIHSGDY